MNLPLYAKHGWLVGLSAFTIACSKEPASNPTHLIKISQQVYIPSQLSSRSTYPPLLYQGHTYHYSHQSEITYLYDQEGRIKEEKHSNPDFPTGGSELGNEFTQYAYKGDTVLCFSSLVGRYSFTMSKLPWDDPQTTYTYDADGFLIRKQTPYLTVVRTIKNQNLLKEVTQEPTRRITSTYAYTLDHLSLINPLAAFSIGKSSRNLLTQTTTLDEPTSGNSSKVTKTYSYSFDEGNRVSKQLELQVNTVSGYEPILTVNRFTYSD